MTRSSTSRRRTTIASALALVAALLAFGSPLSASADVVGDGPGTVSGLVTLADGTPVAGAYVNVSKPAGQGSAWGYSTNSDANGAYEFVGLPLDEVFVQLYISGYQQPAGQTVTISEASPTASVNFVLEPFVVGVGTIAGVVTADGVPVANTSVSAYNQATSQNVYTSTDENGAYAFTELSNGQWNVSAFLGPQYQYLPSLWATLTDAAPAATVNFSFESWPTGTASIGGAFTNAETGEPIAGLTIHINSQDAPHQSSTSTDENGAFSVDLLPEGTYSLYAWTPEYLLFNEQVQLGSGETVTLNPALVPKNATITGHIATAAGAPAEGIWVSAYSATGNSADGFTDANGDYVIEGLGAVEYTLSFGGPSTPYDRVERTVLPVANGNVVADFTAVARTTGYLTGWIVQPNGEAHQAPVCVTLYGSKNKKPLAEVVTLGDNFGDGTYSFDGLKPGKYTVEIRDCDDDPATKYDKVFLGGVKNYKDATFVTIVAGQDSYQNDVVLTPRH